jgi:hypothetical protein
VELELFDVVFGPTAPPRSKKRRFGEWTSIPAPNFYYGNSIDNVEPAQAGVVRLRLLHARGVVAGGGVQQHRRVTPLKHNHQSHIYGSVGFPFSLTKKIRGERKELRTVEDGETSGLP